MDFHLKQWRIHQQQQEDESEEQPSAKSPRLPDHDPPHPHHQQHSCGSGSGSPALPLFVSEQLSTKLSAFPSSAAHSTATPASRFPMGMGSSYFNLGQWQELELQALIFRHMMAGAAVPHELLHLVKKSLSNNTTTTTTTTTQSPYNNNNYLHHSLQQYYPHYQPTLLQSGYWGRGAMDPEPGRCRRTDGKKWRCSRDVVAGHKYCERHMHRGRNRSRKPVEIPTPSSTTASGGANGGSGGGALLKSNNSIAAHPLTAMSEGSHFSLSGTRPPIDLLHFNQRLSDPKIENKGIFEPHNGRVSGDDKSGDRILRHFFDDWPKSDNTGSSSSPVASATNLSISTPRDPPSDFSLSLSTGNGDDEPTHQDGAVERERLQQHWAAAGWGTNQVAPMGGPLAEALRSSTSSSSPTSVLHQLQRGSISRTSYVST